MIIVTPDGILNVPATSLFKVDKLLMFWNAYAPILVTVSGIVTVTTFVKSLNPDAGISVCVVTWISINPLGTKLLATPNIVPKALPAVGVVPINGSVMLVMLSEYIKAELAIWDTSSPIISSFNNAILLSE